MSIFGKFIWDLTVPAGGWTFAFTYSGARTVTIAAGSYNIYTLCAALHSGLEALGLGVAWDVDCSEIGIVSITGDDAWATNWAGTTNLLEDALGYDGTESVVGGPGGDEVLTANGQHLYGYYPGLISWGYSVHQGVGMPRPWRWAAAWERCSVRTTAMDGTGCSVVPDSVPAQTTLEFGRVKTEEVNDDERGIEAWATACAGASFRWYPDRTLGTPTVPGAQNGDYYLCTFTEKGDPLPRPVSAELWTFTVGLNKEPA